MEINKLYNTLIGEVNLINEINSSYVPPMAFEYTEFELLSGLKYKKHIPENYPSDEFEEMGYRKINRPSDVIYRDRTLRIGTIDLHIKEENSDNNINSIVMIYSGNQGKIDNLYGGRAQVIPRPKLVHMLENEIISTGIILPEDIGVIQSFYPDGKQGYGGEFKDLMEFNISRAGIEWDSELDFLMDLYFLAKNSIEQTKTIK